MTFLIGPSVMQGGKISVSIGGLSVTTSSLNIDTGLSKVLGARPGVKAATLPLTGAAFTTVDYDGTDGLIDIYCWSAINTPALLPATISWVAWGIA